MFIVNTAQPLILVLFLMVTILLIFLGRELKKSYIPAIALFGYVIILIMHAVQIVTLSDELAELYVQVLAKCLTVDFIMIFISFCSYLWIDDIECKFYKKKSIDNSLDWFWNKV